MALLPHSAVEFSDPSYWKGFFEKHQAPFEWYGSFNELEEGLVRYLKPSDHIVQIGCGNSLLASQLYDNGYKHILSIDTNEDVIIKQIQNNKEKPELSFICTSALQIDVDTETVNVVLDKGTLDALLPPDYSEKQCFEVVQMFEEVHRILTPSGRYVIVSLAQSHVLRKFVEHFAKNSRYMIRVQKVSNVNGFFMPIFLLIATKTRLVLPSLVIEFARSSNDKPERCADIDGLFFTVRAHQEYSWFVHRCQRKLSEEISLVLCDRKGRGRYKVIIVDDSDASVVSSYSVFIVPPGRENEWLFATEKGRRFLRTKCGVTRLAFVIMYRDQLYGDIGSIKKELDAFVWQFDSRSRARNNDTVISYLTLEGDSSVRTVAKGQSLINGPWVVEEVIRNEKLYRRLTFLSSQNLLQTEVSLASRKKGRKVVNLDVLASEYHETMLAALAFLPEFSSVITMRDLRLKIAVLGLGGGALPSFLCRKLPTCHVIAVEYDDEIVEVAKKYFGLVIGSNGVDVRVKDAVTFVKDIADHNEDASQLINVIFIDVAGSMDNQGMCCPPSSFVKEEVIEALHSSLSNSGVLAMNVVTRDEDVSHTLKKAVKAFFRNVFSHTSVETINEILICSKSNVSLKQAKKSIKSRKSDDDMLRIIASNVESLKTFES